MNNVEKRKPDKKNRETNMIIEINRHQYSRISITSQTEKFMRNI